MPQCSGPLERSKHPPPPGVLVGQQVWLPTHAAPPLQLQVPLTQASPVLQLCPQLPQLEKSLLVSMQLAPQQV
jgi:hypothetical protein